MSLFRATLATSRRTGSKPLMITASGVSATIRSIPVACWRARMLRPSLPMMRPILAGFLFGGGPNFDRLLFGLEQLLLGLGFSLEKGLLCLELQDLTPVALPAAKQQVGGAETSGEAHHDCHK